MRAIGRLILNYLLITMLVKGTSTLTRGRLSIWLSKSWALILLMTLLIVQPEKTHAQSPDWIWAKGFGASRGFGDAYGNSVVVSHSGDVYTTGIFIGNVDFDPGPGSYELNSNGLDAIYISKLDSDGNFVWAKVIGSVVDDYYSGIWAFIATDAFGNIFVSSTFHVTVDFDPGPGSFYLSPVSEFFDVFVVKLDSSGNFIWAKSFGGNANDWLYSFCIDSSNNYLYLTGTFEDTVDFDPGSGIYNLTNLEAPDAFISKLDLDGNFVWAKAIGGLSEIRATSIDLDTTGNPLIAGYFWDSADFDPETNVFELTSNGAKDIFIVKLDIVGNLIWAKSIGGPSWDDASDLVIEPTTGIILTTGFFDGTVDFDPGPDIHSLMAVGNGDIYISRLDSTGTFLSAISMGGLELESGTSITIDPMGNGGIYLTGFFRGLADFDPGPGTYYLTPNGLDDIFIVKLNSSGNFVWAYNAGGESFDYSWSITLDPFGYGLITGFFQSYNTRFGNTMLINIGNSTAFVAKFFACNGIVSNTSDASRGSLRDAITCSPDNTSITFNLPPMSQITLTSGEILIDRNLFVLGTGVNNLTISGNNTSRIFNLLPGRNLNIDNLSLKNAASLSNGGALLVKGNLTLKNALLENNFENGAPKSMTLMNPGGFTCVGQVDIKF